MKRQDLQNVFGPAPDEFTRMVNDTLNGLEDQNMRKRTKFSTALIAAVLVMTLLAGAAFAASKLDLWKAFDYADPLIPLPSADALVVTDVTTAETDYYRAIVQEAVYDGYGAVVKLRVEPKDPEKYVVIADWAMPADVGDDFLSEVVKEHEDGYIERRITGRKDGKEIILVAPRLDATKSGLFMNSYRENHCEDGSIEYWIHGMYSTPLPDTLEVLLNVNSFNLDMERAYGKIEKVPFSLTKSNQERKVKLVPVDGSPDEFIKLIDAEIVFTEVLGYIHIEHQYGSAVEDPDMCWIHLLDANGEMLDHGGQGYLLENGNLLMSYNMQTYETLPDTLTLQLKYPDGGPIVAEIECKLEPIA